MIFFCKKCPACKERYHDSTCPNNCDKIYGYMTVFRAKLGARYHRYNGCHGASIQLTAKDAEACGLTPCNHFPSGKETKPFVPSTLPGSTEVFCTEPGSRFHRRKGCCGASVKLSLMEAECLALTPCNRCGKEIMLPTLPDDTEVFRKESGSRYHLYKGCHGATASLSLAEAECLTLTPCHRVSAEAERLAQPKVKDTSRSSCQHRGSVSLKEQSSVDGCTQTSGEADVDSSNL